ncbi:endolytic transglycosylase MltG [Thermobifida halotolerans]|uniref:Endolytic murein transglycosylase n=1 Tax=Thermobifida halotolerans TaxID=483545 RepID=A0AA97LTH8_9ACTN|nr:endolytic transglycosylase MltG [Thermobifida halotolerans]UOE17769.1 endolytic transglycosylase MltG [Thermobifida halotolerans]
MNGNDRYDDYPRRSRRPDQLADPWPPHREADAPRTGSSAVGHGGRGYRDEYGGGRRRRADTPSADSAAWRRTSVSDAGVDGAAETERPRGRRRRPGPADTGPFTLPTAETEALRERPRGRRRKPESEDESFASYRDPERTAPDTGAETVERGTGRRRAADTDEERFDGPDASRSRRSHRTEPEPWEDEQPARSRRSRVPDPDDEDTPRRGRRARTPEPDEEESPRRGRRQRRTPEPGDEDAGSFALPFDDTGDADEDPPRRSRGGRRGTRGSGGRRTTRRKRKRSKAALMSALLVLVLFVGSAGVGGYLLLRAYVIPPDYSGEGTGEVSVVIEEGDSGTAIAEKLHEAGVIASVRAFTNEIRFSEANFVPGTYQLREQMSAEAAINLLLDPDSRVAFYVTIREGLRAGQILEELAAQTDIPLEEFQAAYEDHEALGLPEYATQGPEGYLFPETYEFDLTASAADILRQMVAQYRQVATQIDLESRAEEAGFDPNEIMAIAAIVQAESGTVEDMGKVSRVVYNRLEIDMYLKMDSTCFYALGEYGIAINGDQQDRCRNDESGYDTYFHEGLPIGPIVSPGRHAIEAALAPEEGPWLYFVTTDPENGVTEFTDSEAEFWDLVEKFNQGQAD